MHGGGDVFMSNRSKNKYVKIDGGEGRFYILTNLKLVKLSIQNETAKNFYKLTVLQVCVMIDWEIRGGRNKRGVMHT